MKIKQKTFKILILVVIVLLCLRAYLPTLVRDYVNRKLDELPEYDGQIGDVDLHLWRGAYSIQDVNILKTSGKVPVPFFSAQDVDFSVQWGALFEGKIVAEIEVFKSKLNFVSGPTAAQSQTSIDSEWLQVVKDLFPLRINRFELSESEIHYKDFHSEPKIDVMLNQLLLEGTNLNNSRHSVEGNEGKIKANAKVEGTAPLEVKTKLDPSAKEPAFSLDLSLRELPVSKLNDFLRAYAAIDAESGVIGIDAEIATSNKKFKGYVKPIIKDLKILSLKNDSDNPLILVWETFVGVWNEIFENQRHEQIAAEIPFSGTFDKPEAGIWSTLGSVLHNAFIEALKPGAERKVSLKNIDKDKEE